MIYGRGVKVKNNTSNKYLVFGFDMETDIGSTSRNYTGVQHGTLAILKILEKYEVPATFLFTGDCALKNDNIVDMIHKKGYEIGCHSMYHEDLGEPSFHTSSFSPILEEELEHRLRLNIEIMQKLTGSDPISFRSPRGFGSNKLIEVLEKLNFKIDSSYMQAIHLTQHFPYFPARDNWKTAGNSSILELPLFAFDLENVDDNTYQKKLDQWPRIRTHGAEFVYKHMQPVVEEQINTHGICALTFYLHPWEFHPMPEKIQYAEGTLYYDEFLYKNTGDNQIREFDIFLDKCLSNNFTVIDFRGFKKVFEQAQVS